MTETADIDTVVLRAQRDVLRSRRSDPQHCPEAGALLAFADGVIEEEDTRDRISAHIVSCAICAAAVRVAIDAAAWSDVAAVDLGPEATRAGRVFQLRGSWYKPSRRAGWVPAALAASLAVLVGAGVLLQRPDDDVSGALRGQARLATNPADGAVLSAVPLRLSWPCESAPGASTVDVMAADATLLWTGEVDVEGCAVSLPTAAHARIGEGETLWRVLDSNGETVVGPNAFRVDP